MTTPQQLGTTVFADIAQKAADVKVSAMKYLDKAMGKLRELGLVSDEQEYAPIVALIDQIQQVDEEKVISIARVLSQSSLFNDVVREQIKEMRYGERYEAITSSFDSIRDDAKTLVEQVEDGKVDTFERLQNIWMKVTRGDIAKRFDDIKDTYLSVAKDTQDQIEREHTILDAYQDFRIALKKSEILALEVLATAGENLEKAKKALDTASEKVEAYDNKDAAERAKLELKRDECLRFLQDEDKRYQISKDLSDNLTVGYNTSEVVMARLRQTNSAKERVYSQSVSFFSTNETVLTALSASFTGLHGLHESTETLKAMGKGIEKSLDTLSEIGVKVQEEALKAGYGPVVRAEAVKKLVDSVVNYQENSRSIIAEMRTVATNNANEIRDIVEDGKRRMSKLEHKIVELPKTA